MGVTIKPSDLFFKYPKNKANRNLPKFRGKPDPNPFDRDDLYDVIPMFEAVMDELGSSSGEVLNKLEELLNDHIPRFIETREEVFDCLVGSMRELLDYTSPDQRI